MRDRQSALLRRLRSCAAVGSNAPKQGRMHLSRAVIEHMRLLGPAPKTRLDALVAKGLSDREIALKLGISAASVTALCQVWGVREYAGLGEKSDGETGSTSEQPDRLAG